MYYRSFKWPHDEIEFEYDPQKSKMNKEKHGIDFEVAQQLWLDDKLIEMPARSEGEPRKLAVGKIGDEYWSAVITFRGKQVRLISARRARKKEIETYESRRV